MAQKIPIQPGFRALEISDFKAFHHQRIDLRPITVLIGPNNSGKSSLVAPLRLLAQTRMSADPDTPLMLDGPFGDFGTYRDLVHGNYRGRPLRITLKGAGEGIQFGRSNPGNLTEWGLSLEFKFRSRRRQLILREAELSDSRGHLLTAAYVPDSDRHVITRLTGKPVPKEYRSTSADLLRLAYFIPRVGLGLPRATTRKSPAEYLGGIKTERGWRSMARRIDDAGIGAHRTLDNVDYIGAMRLPPARTYHQTGEARSRIGAAGENWAGLLVLDSSRTGRSSKGVLKEIDKWLKRAGLAKRLTFNWLSDRHYEVLLEHPITNEAENLADVGQANSQLLPVLVGGLRLPAGSTYIVEEPEIHLHPQAQAVLGDFFVDLWKRRQVSVILETHSEYLLLRLQQAIARGAVNPSDVVIYYVDATKSGKRVRRLELDADARFVKPLPGGFFPQRLEEARKLARIRGT